MNYLVWHKNFGPAQNILGPVKGQGIACAFSKIDFCTRTKGYEEALNAVKFLAWLKKFGPTQNILGPAKGQDINCVQATLDPNVSISTSIVLPHLRNTGIHIQH